MSAPAPLKPPRVKLISTNPSAKKLHGLSTHWTPVMFGMITMIGVMKADADRARQAAAGPGTLVG